MPVGVWASFGSPYACLGTPVEVRQGLAHMYLTHIHSSSAQLAGPAGGASSRHGASGGCIHVQLPRSPLLMSCNKRSNCYWSMCHCIPGGQDVSAHMHTRVWAHPSPFNNTLTHTLPLHACFQLQLDSSLPTASRHSGQDQAPHAGQLASCSGSGSSSASGALKTARWVVSSCLHFI